MADMNGDDVDMNAFMQRMLSLRHPQGGGSEDALMEERYKAFLAEHPVADGWTAHRIAPDAHGVLIPRLPAFLRAKLPPGSWEENMLTDMAHSSGRGVVRRRLRLLPHRKRGKGLSEFDWAGEIRFKWKGVDIHCERFYMRPYDLHSTAVMTLVATRDWSALENCWEEGLRWCKPRNSKRLIYVINGEDIPRSEASWEDLILPGEQKRDIRESFETFLQAKKQYRELGLPYRRGFLFSGPPGNGKTLTAKVLASQYPVNMVTLHIKSDLDESHLDMAFRRASGTPPCVLLLEDLDKIIRCTRVSLSYLLNQLDGLRALEGVLVIATTNEPQTLDPALLHRPSRFDRVWDFGLPAESERLGLLRLRGSKKFSDAALASAARRSAGFSGAYVQEAIVSALMVAAHEKRGPVDQDLDRSVTHLSSQIKMAGKALPNIGQSGGIGFNVGDGARPALDADA